MLHVSKEMPGSWKGKRHGPQLAQDLVPLGDSNSFLVSRNGTQDLREPVNSVRGQSDCLGSRVQNPTEDLFPGGPRAVPLFQFLDGHWLLAVWIIFIVQRPKDCINGVH